MKTVRSLIVTAVAVMATTLTSGCTTPGEVPGLTDPAALTDYTGPSTITGGTVVIENKRITSRLTV